MGGTRTAADDRLERYLTEHDYTFEFEPDWATVVGIVTAKDPDYLVQRSSHRVICEVKGFTTDRISRRMSDMRYGTLSDKEVYGSVRATFADAAPQLAPFASTGLPLVIVLANPLGVAVFLKDTFVQHALIGNPKFSIPIDTTTGGAVGPGRWIAEDYAVAMHPKSAHVSGVVVIHERAHAADWREAEAAKIRGAGNDDEFDSRVDQAVRMFRAFEQAEEDGRIPAGSYTWAEVFELHALHDPQPPAIPSDLFNAPRDRRFGILPSGGYGEIDAPSEPPEE